MIENNEADLSLLMDYFVDSDCYTKYEILSDLQAKQKEPDFLCLLTDDGFLLGYKSERNALWIAQLMNHGRWKDMRDMVAYAKEWAKKRGMLGIAGETGRDQLRAMERLGWVYISTVVGQRI